MKDLAGRIREIREYKGLTQEIFAKELGLDRTYISKLEKGAAELKDRYVSAICRVYGVNEIWLRTGAGDMFFTNDAAETPEERELLAIFRRFTADMRDFFLKMGRELLEKSEKKRETRQDEVEKGEKAG